MPLPGAGRFNRSRGDLHFLRRPVPGLLGNKLDLVKVSGPGVFLLCNVFELNLGNMKI